MAGPEDIIVHIAIAGQDDIISSLGEVGKAGEDAFARLAESVGAVGEVFAKVSLAVAGVVSAVGLLAESGAKATQAVGDLAASTGTSVENISAMQLALGSVGGSTDNLAFTMRRLASQVTRAWDEIQKSVSDRANVITASQLKVQETSQSLIAAQQKLREESQRIGGGPLPGAAAAPRSPFQQQQDQRAEAELKYRQAVLASSEAQKAAADAQRNDINNVVEAIGKVIAGEETLAQTATKINPTLDNVFKGIVGNSTNAATAIENFNGDYLKLAAAAPNVSDVLAKSAEFFKNSGDAALNAALGLREFGRGSGTLVSALQQLGGEGLKNLVEQFKQLGFETTKTDEFIARRFNVTLFSLQSELGALRDQISTPFQAAITPGLQTFQKFIEDSRAKIVELADELANKAGPAIRDFFDVLSGKEAARTTWVQPLADAIGAVAKAFGQAAIAGAAFLDGLTGGKTNFGKGLLSDIQSFGTQVKGVFGGIRDILNDINHQLDLFANKLRDKVGLPPNPVAPSAEEFNKQEADRKKKAEEENRQEDAQHEFERAAAAARTGAVTGTARTPTTGTVTPPKFVNAPAATDVAAPPPAPSGATANLPGAGTTVAPPSVPGGAKFVTPPSPGQSPAGQIAAPGAQIIAPQALINAPELKGAPPAERGTPGTSTFTGALPQPGPAISGTTSGFGIGDLIAAIKTALTAGVATPPAATQQQGPQGTNLASDFAQLDDQTKSLSQGFGAALPDVLNGLAQLGAALAAAASSVPSASQGKAEGGVVSGPGGPKDDKVPIMASAGEYVVTADGSNLHKAIAHFGGGSGGQQTFAQRTGISTNLGHIKDRVHYALGGLVEALQRPIAHYAVGGPVQAGASVASGQRPINLFIGDEKVTGLTATDSAARSISRLAVARSVRSGGTKASWYRGS